MVELADKMDCGVSYLPFLHNDLPILSFMTYPSTFGGLENTLKEAHSAS
jgi:hypothetical protein